MHFKMVSLLKTIGISALGHLITRLDTFMHNFVFVFMGERVGVHCGHNRLNQQEVLNSLSRLWIKSGSE